jgi:hypothetical protein
VSVCLSPAPAALIKLWFIADVCPLTSDLRKPPFVVSFMGVEFIKKNVIISVNYID